MILSLSGILSLRGICLVRKLFNIQWIPGCNYLDGSYLPPWTILTFLRNGNSGLGTKLVSGILAGLGLDFDLVEEMAIICKYCI